MAYVWHRLSEWLFWAVVAGFLAATAVAILGYLYAIITAMATIAVTGPRAIRYWARARRLS